MDVLNSRSIRIVANPIIRMESKGSQPTWFSPQERQVHFQRAQYSGKTISIWYLLELI